MALLARSTVVRALNKRYQQGGNVFLPPITGRGLGSLSSQSPPFMPGGQASAKQMAARTLSSTSTKTTTTESSSFSPINWWRGRQERKEAAKYKERIEFMANKDHWTLGDMSDELGDVVKGWLAKMSDTKEMKMAKQMNKTVNGIIAVVGRTATDSELEAMSRKDKLQAALAGETTVEEVNLLIQQFDTMSLMHRVLRKRKSEGKSIPATAEAMQAVIQADGKFVLSKSQKAKMKERTAQMMGKSLRRR